jgi:hypothetical protein
MKFRTFLIAALALALSCAQALAQATILPPGEQCFQATTGVNGMVGVLGTITGGSSYTNGTYGGVPLTGGSGTNATANITVSGGIVTQVTVLNPGIQYVVGDTLSAAAANIGGTGSGFSVPINSISINSSLAGGSVTFYVPNTQSFKQTWQDSGQTTLNQNPVPLDANGCAVIYGSGVYRSILKDSIGNTVWDKLTASTSPVGIFWAGLAGGTGNAITITDSAFALQDGATIQFLAKAANTGPATVSVSGGSAIAIVNDTTSGPAALTGGEIDGGNTPIITYDATNFQFHLINRAAVGSTGSAGTAIAPPQGYLNLVGQASGNIIQTADVANTGVIYYSPFVGNSIPIWNGSTFKTFTFSEMTLTLTAAGSPSGAIQDGCVFSNNGVPTLVAGPTWTTATAGAGNRGSGAGTAQITRLQGIWVNAVSILGYNGLSSFTIPVNQCTYVGSLSINGGAGLVSALVSWGQSRVWGVWNAYNRQPIQIQAGDNTSYSYLTNTWRVARANTGNNVTVFTGLAEEPFVLSTSGYTGGTLGANQKAAGAVGIGWNSQSSPLGRLGEFSFTNSTANTIVTNQPIVGSYLAPPALGINTVYGLENGLGADVSGWSGTQNFQVISAQWRG